MSKKRKPYHIWKFSSIFASFQYFLPCLFSHHYSVARGLPPRIESCGNGARLNADESFRSRWNFTRLPTPKQSIYKVYSFFMNECASAFITLKANVDWLTETGNMDFIFCVVPFDSSSCNADKSSSQNYSFPAKTLRGRLTLGLTSFSIWKTLIIHSIKGALSEWVMFCWWIYELLVGKLELNTKSDDNEQRPWDKNLIKNCQLSQCSHVSKFIMFPIYTPLRIRLNVFIMSVNWISHCRCSCRSAGSHFIYCRKTVLFYIPFLRQAA